MVVEDKYADSDREAGNTTNPAFTYGAQPAIGIATISVAVADDDLSVYRMFSDVPGEWIPTKIDIKNEALSGGTDYDLGLYRTNRGAVINKNIFADALDMSSAANDTPKNGLENITDLANLKKKIFEHAGHTTLTKLDGYDIALTANVVGAAAGEIVCIGYFIQG